MSNSNRGGFTHLRDLVLASRPHNPESHVMHRAVQHAHPDGYRGDHVQFGKSIGLHEDATHGVMDGWALAAGKNWAPLWGERRHDARYQEGLAFGRQLHAEVRAL